MSKKKILALVATVLFLALTMVSTFAVIHINDARASDARTTTIHLAFTGLVTYGLAKGTPITGGLTETIRSTGYFNGNLRQPDGTQTSTSGRVNDKYIEITFYDASGAPTIKGQGHFTKAGNYVGTFQVYYSDKHIDKGLWSALPIVNPGEVNAFAFVGLTIKGPAKNTTYTGAIILDEDGHAGIFNLPNGTLIPLIAKIDKKGNITVTFNLSSSSHIVGTGKPSHTGNLKGYTGTFVGPNTKDAGNWVAYRFRF